MTALFYIFSLITIFATVFGYECINGTTNKFIVSSDSKKLPVMLDNLEVTVYDKTMKPSCAFDKPNVLFPGYFQYSKGTLHIKRPYKLIGRTFVKLTAISETGTEYCVNGESAQWYIPDALCVYDFCEAIGEDVCKLMGKPGVHTIEDLVEQAGYSRRIKLPDEPCFLNALCAHDLLSGRYHLKLAIEYKGKLISRWNVPSNMKYVQFYVNDDEDDDQDDEDDSSDDDGFGIFKNTVFNSRNQTLLK